MLRMLDAYSFPARVVPVLAVVAPAFVLLMTGVTAGTGRIISSGAVLTVLSAIAAQVGRDRGKRLEPSLWAQWGGGATLRRLRYADAADASVVRRLHGRIEAVLGDPMPTQAEEEADPDAADARYEEATRRLIARTRDRKRFGLLFAENVNYGMRRNLLGLRRIGGVVSGVTAGVAGALLAIGGVKHPAAHYAPTLAVALLAVVFWIFIVDRDWVRIPAEAYAERLVESVEILQQEALPTTDGPH
jgi:hypothetical protein